MFSGAPGDLENIRKYEAHAQRGGAVLVADIAGTDAMSRAQSIMQRGGEVDVHEHGEDSSTLSSDDPAADQATSTVQGPQGNALPNASTGWDTSRAGSRSTTGDVGHDPARPQGLVRDASGLGPRPPKP